MVSLTFALRSYPDAICDLIPRCFWEYTTLANGTKYRCLIVEWGSRELTVALRTEVVHG